MVLYDLLLLGALLADEEQAISEQWLTGLLLINPTDAYRVFNLTATENISQIVGLADIAVQADIGIGIPLLSLGGWLLTAMLATIALLYRREL